MQEGAVAAPECVREICCESMIKSVCCGAYWNAKREKNLKAEYIRVYMNTLKRIFTHWIYILLYIHVCIHGENDVCIHMYIANGGYFEQVYIMLYT